MTTYQVETITVGPLEVNCYVLACATSRAAAVIDPGAEGGRIIRRIEQQGFQPVMILNTHGHLDHTAANADLARRFQIPLYIHQDDAEWLRLPDLLGLAELLGARPSPDPARLLLDGDTLAVGSLRVRILHTPGHTPGSVCFLVEDLAFAGDTVFAGSVGRTDLPGGDWEALSRSLAKVICPLPKATRIMPGHGPSTTVGGEKCTNPFFPR